MEDQRLPDPSANVLQLVGNATQYLEKLHEMGQKYNDDKLQLAVEASRRERAAESERINALRKVDVDAVSVANDRAITQAQLLNAQMLDNAEVLRKSVEATASTIAIQFDKMTTQQNDRIAALERINSENMGKASSAPDMQELVSQLIAAQNIAKGRSGLSTPLLMMVSGAIVGVIVFLLEAAFK